jgi:methionyl-tRNA formyltransferase
MRLVFCGTPRFAVPTLKYLLVRPELQIVAVISQPDRPSGRGLQSQFSPVKEAALSAGLPIHQPEKIRSPEAQTLLQELAPDCVVIIAYGQIIPARLLSIPKHGWINLHASLLPKYRGAAPINWAIANGETKTGLTTMRIDAGMDTGDMLLQEELEIGNAETAPELAARLSEAGAPLMAKTLRGLIAGNLIGRAQDDSQATYAPILKKEDGRVDWSRPAEETFNRIRGFTPWPGAYTEFRGKNCQVWGVPVSLPGASNRIEGRSVTPGTLFYSSGTLTVICGGATALALTAVKIEGRKQVSAAEFANGARLTDGERLGDKSFAP